MLKPLIKKFSVPQFASANLAVKLCYLLQVLQCSQYFRVQF
jgi:hypothetical protein